MNSLDTVYLDNLPSDNEHCWVVQVHMGDQETLFKLDTGAEVTAIGKQTYGTRGNPALSSTNKLLHGPSTHPLDVLGQFHRDLFHKGNTMVQPVFVVMGLRSNLLGHPAIVALNLAARLDENTKPTVKFMEKFPKVFTGLRSFKEAYKIKLKPNVTPLALYTPQHVPLPLRPKVSEELSKIKWA